MNRVINFFVALAFFSSGFAQEQSLRSLIESASRFPPVDEETVLKALDAIKEMPDAEKQVWDFIENADVSSPFHVENGLSVLERTGLVNDASVNRSRNILKENAGRTFNASSDTSNVDPEVNSLGFGTPTGDGAEAFLRELNLVSGSIGLLGKHGSIDDVILISEFIESESEQISNEAVRAIETIKNRERSLPIEKPKIESKKASIGSETNSTSEEKPPAFVELSGGVPYQKWPWVVAGIAVLGILFVLAWAFMRSRGTGGRPRI